MIEKIVEESILSVALFLYQKSGMVGVKETANENVLFDFAWAIVNAAMILDGEIPAVFLIMEEK